MTRRSWSAMAICIIAAAALTTGCATHDAPRDYAPTASLLFGPEPGHYWSTKIGRSDWPAVTDGFKSVEDTVYVEYYRDYYGGSSWEQNTPRRTFRSYRTAVSQR